MEKLLNNFIDEIGSVIGVRTAYLINNRGEILFPQTEKLGRTNLTPAGGLDLVQALGAFELAGEEVNEMELTYLEGKVIIYNTIKLNVPSKLGVQETFLVILGDKNLNKAHLRLALNVSLAHIVSDKKYKKQDLPVRIRKSSVLSREKLNEKDLALVEKIRGYVSS
jgi:hypothetical protein